MKGSMLGARAKQGTEREEMMRWNDERKKEWDGTWW